MQRVTHITHAKRLLTNRLARAEASCRLLLRCKDTKNQCLTQTFYKIYDFFAFFHILINIPAHPAPYCIEPKKGARKFRAPRADIVAGKTGLDLFNHYFPYGLAGLHDVNA